MLSALEVIERQAVTLFRHDAGGRLLAVNEPDLPPAPRLFVGRTTEGNIWRVRHDLPAQLALELSEMLRDEPVVADLSRPVVTLARLCEALTAYAPIESIWQGPAWYVPADLTISDTIRAEPLTDMSILQSHFPGMDRWVVDCLPCVVVAEDGNAVAVCFSSRTSEVAAEAGIETAEGYRGRGYASAAVVAWAGAVRATGRLPLYSTSWDNRASQGVARRLGLVRYGADLHIT